PGEDRYAERWLLWGPTVDAPRLFPGVAVYLEGVGQRRATADAIETGYGLYGTVTAAAGATGVLVEGKAYGDLAVVTPFGASAPASSLPFGAVQYATLPT